MKKALLRPDFWITILLFLAMIPAEQYEIFSGFENQLQGYRHILRHTANPEAYAFPEKDMVIVDTDEEFFSEYGSWPLQRKHIAEIVTNLQELGAKVVALDMLMDFPNGYGEDPILAEALGEKPNTMVVSQLNLVDEEIRGVTTATSVLQEEEKRHDWHPPGQPDSWKKRSHGCTSSPSPLNFISSGSR